MKSLCIFSFLLFFTLSATAQDSKGKEYLYKMLDAIENVKTARYELLLHERIQDRFRDSEFQVKLNVRPFRLYARSNYPNMGAEALLNGVTDSRKVLINPNRFPYINLNLNSHSSMLRKNHHYTLHEVGFAYIEKILRGYIRKEGDGFYRTLRFVENIEFNGKNYHMLEMDYQSYNIVDYTVENDENISTIADKLLVNDYKILSLNPQVGFYDDVEGGQVIKVPSAFARRIVLYLDKTTLLPFIQNVYDENGLFGRYEIKNFVLNPTFEPEEFSSSYNGYGF